MTSLDRLGVLLQNILQKVTDKEVVLTRDALIPAMPQVVASLMSIVNDPETSQSAKLRAHDILYSLFAKVTRLDLKKSEAQEGVARAGARKQQFAARAARAKVEEKELTLKERKHQERKSKRLAEALTAVDKIGEAHAS